jgi:general secretion pathway protein D|uniref:Amuc_1098 family type IV pilus outer membrane protein n=1 Tax=Prosthecobacter sp. TaxID=1965333 RepID=UPI0037830123
MPRFRLIGGALTMTLAALSFSLGTIRAQSVSALAEKEARRRAISANKAIDDIQRGYELINQQKAEEALALFTTSYESLPETPLTHEARLAAQNGYVVAGCMHARALQSKGAYKQAGDLLDNLLTISPKDSRVAELKQQFADPDRWPPALTEKHITDVHEVQKLLIKADSFRELGDYDNSIKTYEDVLRIDPANSAARRGMESVERARQSYFKAAYDHTRSKMLSAVDQKWEDPVPLTAQDVSVMFGARAAALDNEQGGREKITQKLRTLIFPQVDFAGATLDEVAELLRVRSRDLDPQGAGINFILNVPPESRNKPISLNLRDVPMEEVLRYVSEMSGVSYKVDDHAVTFVSLSERSGVIISRSFRVPPDFIQNAPAGDAGAAAPADPFGAQAPAGGGLVIRRMGAKEFLEARGVAFPEGSSANFNSNTSTLTVRNTVANMEMVEMFVEQASKAAPKMAVITVRMLEVNQTNLDELGFDWLLGGAGTNGNNVFFGGGSAGSGTPYTAANYPFASTLATPATVVNGVTVFPSLPVSDALAGPLPSGITSSFTGQVPGGSAPIPVGGGPISSGLRSGTYATGLNSLDALLRTGSATSSASVAPGVLSVAGVFTDPQFQTVIRGLAQKKGIDVNASPSVTTKNGLKATVEITREFIYPTEFDPPQLPQGGGGLTLGGGGGGQQMIATPTTPTAFEMRKTGVLVDVEPVISDDGRSIELTITPELTDFEGFVNYGSPIFSPSSRSLLPIQLGAIAGAVPGLAGVAATTGYVPISQPEQLITPNYILQPIFKTRKVATSVKIWDGATVVLGGAKVQKRTMVDDRIPVLGNLPFVGWLFRSEVAETETKNIIIFVTVDVIDPSGQKVNRDTAAVAR